jgi:hypothetical protein
LLGPLVAMAIPLDEPPASPEPVVPPHLAEAEPGP